jgi:GR25 family glycosyltransferase involved in LPS biosynthesis
MKLGEVACSMGHKAIYEDAVNNGYSKILILEDDVSINQEGIVLFNQIVNQLPINWDIIYFDYFKNEEKNCLLILSNLFITFKKALVF